MLVVWRKSAQELVGNVLQS